MQAVWTVRAGIGQGIPLGGDRWPILYILTPEEQSNSVRRSGLKANSRKFSFVHGLFDLPRGVFAMPVTPNFYVSHQWLRELKRTGQRKIVGVYFRIPDRERVWIGHYNRDLVEVSAAEAVGIVMHHRSPLGYEVYIPRKIRAQEITRVRSLPQVVGWRCYPQAKGRKPCGCPVCLRRGEIKSQHSAGDGKQAHCSRLRQAFAARKWAMT